MKSKAVADKEKYELNHLGRFERLYPVTGQDDPYQKYIDYVMEMQQTMTGPRRQKVIEKN